MKNEGPESAGKRRRLETGNISRKAGRLLAVIAAAAFLPAAIPASGQQKTLDRIVAIVGNEIITKSELDLQMLRYAMRGATDMSDPKQRSKALDEMIARKLILAQAVLDSVEVSEEQVSAQLEEQIKMFEQSYGSIERLEQAAGMSIAQMKREFRDDIRKNLMVETLQREKFSGVTVTHREVEEFFAGYRDTLPMVPEQAQLRQITIFPQVLGSFRETARAKAQAILDSLEAGADFEEMARRHSDDAGSARNGGDLGEARRGVFVRNFEEAAFTLQPGEISPIVETEFGFHIIKLVDKKGELIRPLHILIRIQKTGESDEAAIQELKDLRARILNGENFETLARAHSQDPLTRPLGGDLGLLEVQQLGDDLRALQQKLSPGEISEPTRISFEKDYGFSIVQLLDRVPPHQPSMDTDYQRIVGWAKIVKQNRMYAEWLENIKGAVYWKVFPTE